VTSTSQPALCSSDNVIFRVNLSPELKMMRKLLLTGVGLAALLASPALSSDLGVYRPTYGAALAVTAPLSWTGFWRT